MARHARICESIRANRLILASCFRVPKLNPFFCESWFGGLKIANRRFEAIRANRLKRYEKRGFRENRFGRIAPIRVGNRRTI